MVDIKTPETQLALLCQVIGNPALPLQQLNRVLQCRMAWRKDKGLPPTYRRALLALAVYLPQDTEPAPKPKLKRAPRTTEPAGGILEDSLGGHGDA